MKFILGTKGEMTQYFAEDGRVYPATIVKAGPITVTQIKNIDADGYNAIQYGFGNRN
jgi:large subunit ribosomal protein L3